MTPPKPNPVALVAEWVLAGMRPSQIPDHIRTHLDKWPGGVEPGQSELLDFIGEAYEQIQDDTVIDPDRENAKAVARLNYLYSKCCAIQDYKGAASVQKELNAVVARVVSSALMTGNPPCPPEAQDRRPPRSRSSRARAPTG